MPHAWKPGAQTELLVKKLNALKDGDTIVMVAPPNPYPLPARALRARLDVRACAQEKGHKKSKIIVLDPKPDLLQAGAVPGRLGEALSRHDRVAGPQDAWRDQGRRSEDRRGEDRSRRTTRRRSPTSSRHRWRARSRATRASRTSPASARSIRRTMKSKMDANIFVVGDACIPGDMPKSAFSANSQAKVAAMIIRRRARQRAHLPGALQQHLLEPDRDRRRREGRRHLRAGRGQDQGGHAPSSARRARRPTCASRTTRSWSTGTTASWPTFSDRPAASVSSPANGSGRRPAL